MSAEAVRASQQTNRSKKAANRISSAKKNTVKKSDSRKVTQEEFNSLVLDHVEYGQKLAWRFLNLWRIRIGRDDINSIVGMALCEAAQRYDSSYGTTFRTFFFYHLRGLLLKEVAERIEQRKLCYLVTSSADFNGHKYDNYFLEHWACALVDRKTPEKILQSKEKAEICKQAVQHLDSLEYEVVVRYFMYEHSLVKIAEDLGYCRCHISRVKTRALNALSEMLIPTSADAEKSKDREQKVIALNLAKRKRYTGGRGRRKNISEIKPTKMRKAERIAV